MHNKSVKRSVKETLVNKEKNRKPQGGVIMYINPIRLTNYNNVNTYKQLNFNGAPATTATTTVDTTPSADTTQFKSSAKAKEKVSNHKQSFAHRLYKTLTNTLQGQADPYFPVNTTSRTFLY